MRNALRERPSHTFRVGTTLHVVRVRESARARHARVTVAPGRPLDVVVPCNHGSADVDALLEQKRAWIERHLAELARRPRLGLDRPGVLWLAGEAVLADPIEIRPRTPLGVERWYRAEARQRIEAAVRREAERLGVRPRGVAVRDPRTLWGSCTSRGNLSFSWRLLLAPERVLDYLVVHELCHLRELNHSRRFWALVEEARPDWRTDHTWLQVHGVELLEYSPALALERAVHVEQLPLFEAA